jgi:hypothetical protein
MKSDTDRVVTALIAVVAAILLISVGEALRSAPSIAGDGKEYLAYLYNLARGHGPYVVELPAGLRDHVLPKLAQLDSGQGAHIGSAVLHHAWIKDESGRVVAWHFWGYSLLCLPAYWVLEALGLGTNRAFFFTNLALVLAAGAYLALASRQTAFFRALLFCLFVLSGTTFYLWWSHPEVMTATLVLLGLVMWLDRRYALSAVCLGLGAMHNPPVVVLFLLPMVGMLGLAPGAVGWAGAKLSIPSVAGFALAIALAMAPTAWYLWHLGVANPIVAGGFAHFGAENFSKAFGVFFDLNQGMVLVALLPMMVLVGYAAAAAVRWKHLDASERARLGFVVLLIVLTYAMSALTASAKNWNPGSTVISRYAYWSAIPVLFAVCIALESVLLTRFRDRITLHVIGAGLFFLALYGVHGKDSDYLSLTPASKFAMQILPNAYFPHPQVFCERVQHRETCDFDRPYVYRGQNELPVRVLVEKTYLQRVCDGLLPIHSASHTQRHDGVTLLWFAMTPVTCPSGVKIDRIGPM